MHRSGLVSLGMLLQGLGAVAKGCDVSQDLAVLAGQHIIYSYSEPSPPQLLMDLTAQGLVGGIILYGANVVNTTPADMEALQRAYKNSPAPAILKKHTGLEGPLLITTDQEGGEVRRIPAGPERSAYELGLAARERSAGTQAGVAAADALTSYNVNANLAPVLGVYRQPGNFLDEFQRSFGNTTVQVIAAAIPFLQAQQAAGAIATAKHFPGLGAAPQGADTDVEPVTLNLTLTEIQDIDEAPFAAAINAGVDMVMPSWAVYPALDSMPSGLSRKWIRGQLRKRLGFTGVTITDAMEAGAIAQYGNNATLVKLATEAGMDVLLAAIQNPTQGHVFQQALASMVCSGELDRTDFDESTQRIMELRSKYANV